MFLKYITTKRPYVIMKTAMTLDGKIAAYTGDSKWVTNEESRKMVHQLRSEMAAVMVGIGTVLADDPMLNVRLEGEHHQPARIVVDLNLRIPIDSQLVKTAKEYRTIVATTFISSNRRESRPERSESFCQRQKNLLQTDEISPFRFASVEMTDKMRVLGSYGIDLIECQSNNGHVDINNLMKILGSMGIDSLLLEGGGTLNAAFLEAGCVDEVWAFIAPKIIGGEGAKTPVSGKGIAKMSDAIQLQDIDIQNIKGDILIKGKICSRE